jgi:hypothetical protein
MFKDLVWAVKSFFVLLLLYIVLVSANHAFHLWRYQ